MYMKIDQRMMDNFDKYFMVFNMKIYIVTRKTQIYMNIEFS